MSTRIIGFGRTLPTEFLQYVWTEHDAPPEDTHVGDLIFDPANKVAWVLVEFDGTGVDALDVCQINQTTVRDSNIPAAVSKYADRFSIAATSVTENQFAGGMMFVDGGTGQGYRSRIASNKATSGGNVEIVLAEKLEVALATSSDVRLLSDKFKNVQKGTAGFKLPVGVAQRSYGGNKYGWIQLGGEVLVVSSASVASADNDGTPFVPAADGEVALQAADLGPIVGYSLITGGIAANAVIPMQLALPWQFA